MEAIYSNYYPSFLYVDKYHFSSHWAYREKDIPYSLFRFICSGSACFKVNEESYSVKANDVFYIPQGCTLSCTAYEEITFISVRFVGSIQMPDIDILKNLWNIEQLYHVEEHEEIREWFEKMYEVALTRKTYKQMEIRGYLNLICAWIAKSSSCQEETQEEHKRDREKMARAFAIKAIRQRTAASYQKTDPRVRALVDYLTLYPEKNLSREEMSAMCGVGVSTLRRIFKAQMGKTIYEFVRDTKMMMAVHLLVTTNEPISDIGYRLGFETASYFTKNFRENFGISPQKYRKTSWES